MPVRKLYTRRGIVTALVITVLLVGAYYAGQAIARPAHLPRPLPAPHSLLRERAACTNLQTCRNALVKAYAGLEWAKRQRLHERILPASNLTPVEVGRELAARRAWRGNQFACLYALWNHESGWQVHDRNWSSQADGIPQANPASKMRAMGGDWRDNAATQIRWGLAYIDARYGTPCAALAYSNTYGYY